MGNDLKKILTQDSDIDGKPLFENARALSDIIVSLGSDHYSSPRSAGTLIRFMFRGERICPIKFHNLIFEAVRRRLSDQDSTIVETCIKRVASAIDSIGLARESRGTKTLSEPDELQFNNLLKTATLAKHQFIITSLTAEEEWDDVDRAAQLNEILLKRLGIHPMTKTAPDVIYEFLLPSKIIATKFWKNLYTSATNKFNGDDNLKDTVTKRLHSLEKSRHLRVYNVPPWVCGCPIVVFNPKSKRLEAYSFCHKHHGHVIDTICWDNITATGWQTNVYDRFYRHDNLNQPDVDSDTDTHFDPKKFPGYRCTPNLEDLVNNE